METELAKDLIAACERMDGTKMEYMESLYVDNKEKVDAEVLHLSTDENILKVIIDGETKYFQL